MPPRIEGIFSFIVDLPSTLKRFTISLGREPIQVSEHNI